MKPSLEERQLKKRIDTKLEKNEMSNLDVDTDNIDSFHDVKFYLKKSILISLFNFFLTFCMKYSQANK